MLSIEQVKKRVSCRTYSDRAVAPDKLDELEAYLQANTAGPFGSRVRFRLLDCGDMAPAEVKALGTYGVIKGAKYFIAGAVAAASAVARQPGAMEDYGYAMEKNILAATAMGLGTCWLGGTFNRTGFAAKMDLQDGELLPAVTPVGYPGDRRSIVDRVFRFSAGSDNRKSWEELFFDGGFTFPLPEKAAGSYATPLACVRIGPSASNRQPWRIVKDNGAFHFYLQRTPGYDKLLGEIKLQNVDMGIAMCHFEISARELGVSGNWVIADPGMRSSGREYIVSWKG